MSDTISISTDELAGLVREILNKAGFSADHAAAIAKTIVAGERDGCKSHGVYRIEGCLRTLKSGKVVADAEPVVTTDDSAVVRVDAKGGFANLAFERGAPALVEKARKLGVAVLAINDCTHFAALWPEVEVLAEQGLAAIAMCPSYATVAPAGGTKPLLGTNPFAFGWPRPGDYPYVFDFATSVAARANWSSIGAPESNCPKAGPSMRTASPRPTRKRPLQRDAAISASTRDRPFPR
jgi:LDH2 family malate/lactate/ureidoglycolate dehydrogenase